jgi:hypothetical protein
VRHRQQGLSNPNRKTEEYAASLVSTYSISTTGWQGKNFSSTATGRQLISEWEDYSILKRLVPFTPIPYKKYPPSLLHVIQKLK